MATGDSEKGVIHDILERLSALETKLDEVLAFVRLVQTEEYREQQNMNDFQINVMADLFVEILEDIRDRKGENNGDNPTTVSSDFCKRN